MPRTAAESALATLRELVDTLLVGRGESPDTIAAWRELIAEVSANGCLDGLSDQDARITVGWTFVDLHDGDTDRLRLRAIDALRDPSLDDCGGVCDALRRVADIADAPPYGVN